MEINDNVIPLILNYVKVSSVLAKRATDDLAKNETAREKAAAEINPIVDLMLKRGTIEPHQKTAALELLGTHSGTLELLKNAVVKMAELQGQVVKQASVNLGQGEDDDNASGDYDSLKTPYVGAQTMLKKASDRALESIRCNPRS